MAYKGGGAQYEREEKSRYKQVQRCYGEVTRVLGNFSASGQETCHGTSSAQRLLRFVQTQPLAGASRPMRQAGYSPASTPASNDSPMAASMTGMSICTKD